MKGPKNDGSTYELAEFFTGTLPVNPDGIPSEMKGRRQWIVWKLELRNGKPTKIPYTSTTSKPASSTDLMTWSTFSEALKAYETGRYAGIGFVFCSADPYSGIDLDKCRDLETSELTPKACDILNDFEGAYIEVSPSCTGVHIIVRGKLPETGTKRGWVEAYSQDRYFTITGRTL